MIGYLRGKVILKQANTIIVETAGVGYELSVPVSVIEQCCEADEVVLFVHDVIRDDAYHLYGFSSMAQRQLFRELIRVNGIGPKLGLLILSGFSVESFIRVIREGNVGALVKLPGVGKKTADRLLMELQDRLGKQYIFSEHVASDMSDIDEGRRDAIRETEEALIALGYKPNIAVDMVKKVLQDWTHEQLVTTDKLLRSVLRQQLPRGN